MTSLRRPLDVLIADDDAMVLEVLSMMVEAIGCRAQTATDGEQALAMLATGHFDVLITDWQMPKLDGIQLVRQLRRERSDGYLHIIMATTRAAERTVRDGLDVEVDDFLFKPIDPVLLELSIASARRSVDLQWRLARRNHHLATANARTREAYRRIRTDLDAAAATQRSLLPAAQLDGPVRHAWLFIPSQGIGGDSLDVRVLSDGRRFFFQLDVSGHGIPAALRSFSLHHRLSARPPLDADNMLAMLAALNRDAQDEPEGAYYTMVCGLVAADGSRVDFVRAGHPGPILVNAGGARSMEAGDPPIGLLPGLRFGLQSVALAHGERLVLHSDGITDCCDRDGVSFGDDRLESFLCEHVDVPLPMMIAQLDDRLRKFRSIGTFEDDVSMLIIERG